jgi:hypothetical protein
MWWGATASLSTMHALSHCLTVVIRIGCLRWPGLHMACYGILVPNPSWRLKKKRKADAYGKYGKAAGKCTRVSAKKSVPIEFLVPKAKIGIKRPSDTKLAPAKSMMKTRKFDLNSSEVQASGLGGTGALSPHAPTATARKAKAPGKGLRINLVSMLGVASPRESQESLPHEPTPRVSEEAPDVSTMSAAPSTAAGAGASLPLVTISVGIGAES